MTNYINKNIAKISSFFSHNKHDLIIVFVSTFVFGLIAHGFCYFNINYSHDSLLINQLKDANWEISIGRYLQPAYWLVRGYLPAPFLIGILSLFFLSCSTFILLKILKIDKKIDKIIICAILTTNATLALLNATYINGSDVFMVALLFSVIGLYITNKYKDDWRFIFGSIFFCCSLAIYQAYIQVATFIMLIILMEACYQKRTVKDILLYAFKFLSVILVACGLYYAFFKITLTCTNVKVSDSYNSLSQFVEIIKNGLFFQKFGNIYTSFFDYLLNPTIFRSQFIGVLNILFIIAIAFSLVIIFYKNKVGIKNTIFGLFLFVLVPVAANFVYLLANGLLTELTIFSFLIIYVWGIQLKEYLFKYKRKGEKIIKYGSYSTGVFTIIFALIFSFSGAVFSNQIYLKKNIEFKNTMNVMNSIINRIESTENYIVNTTPVILIGNLGDGPLAYKHDYFYYEGVGLWYPFSVTYYSSYVSFIHDIMQHPMLILPESEIANYKDKELVKNMPFYPYNDSCKNIDGTVVVKLSD